MPVCAAGGRNRRAPDWRAERPCRLRMLVPWGSWNGRRTAVGGDWAAISTTSLRGWGRCCLLPAVLGPVLPAACGSGPVLPAACGWWGLWVGFGPRAGPGCCLAGADRLTLVIMLSG